MNVIEAIECCYRVIGRDNSNEVDQQCKAWLETLLLMSKLGFKHVSIEGNYKKTRGIE